MEEKVCRLERWNGPPSTSVNDYDRLDEVCDIKMVSSTFVQP